MSSDDIECPRCKTTKYRNPELKLLVNVCGHPLCEKCIDLMFANGAAKCYQCPTPLKRGNFKKQLFQDISVEKDLQFRRDILRKFKKPQDAFPSLRAYNDYLEKLETVIYNKANGLEPELTERLLDELQRPPEEKPILSKKPQVKEIAYYHKASSVLKDGPDMPNIDDNYRKAIRNFSTREVAGGFTADLAIRRALGEAFTNLYSQHCKLSMYVKSEFV